MTRRQDWQSRLGAFLALHMKDPFAWGSWDCALWTASAIAEMTGVDIAEKYRGQYSGEKSAMSLCFHETGGSADLGDMVAKVTAEFGMPEVKPPFAQRGDMALTKQCLGLVSLNGVEIIVLDDQGMRTVPLTEAIRVWRVG